MNGRLKHPQYILYGAGRCGLNFYGFLNSIGYNADIVAFCDKLCDRVGNIDGVPVIDYDAAKDNGGATIILTVSPQNKKVYLECKKQLNEDNVNYIELKDFFDEIIGQEKREEYRKIYYWYENRNIFTLDFFNIKKSLECWEISAREDCGKRYVWFMPDFPFLKMIFNSLNEERDILVIDALKDANKIFSLPKDEKLIFIVFNPWGNIIAILMPLLRKRFKKSKFIFYSYDTGVFKQNNRYNYSDIFDSIYTFDEDFANKWGFSFYPGLYQALDRVTEMTPRYDIVWSGVSHGRFKDLVRVYDLAEKNGLRCWFVVVDDNTYEKDYRDGIEFVKQLDPQKSLEVTLSGKCALDLIKHNEDDAMTIRFYEAITYGMKLLTNNDRVLKSKYYNPHMIGFFQDVNSIDFYFLRDKRRYDYGYNEEFTPRSFLKYVENAFESEG